MESEEKPSIRFKRRFGFNGPSKWRQVEGSTVDDLLDSMARRKELSGKIHHEPLEQLDNDQEFPAVGAEPSSGSTASRLRTRRLAVVAAFWTGVAIWLSGYLNSLLGPFSLEGIIQGSNFLSAFELPLKLVFVLFVFVVPAVSSWRGRRPLPPRSYK